jgi:hypothetical protein
MIYNASLLLTDAWITLAQLVLESFSQQLRGSSHRRDRRRAREIERIRTEIESYQDEFFGSAANSISDLYHRLIEANKKARESPSPEHSQTAANLKRTVDTLVEAANYSYARAEFAVLRRRLTEAGAVFVAGIVIFAYAANPPKPATPNPAAGHTAVQPSPSPVPTRAAKSPAAAGSTPGVKDPARAVRRSKLAVPGELRAARERRGRMQDVKHQEARGGYPAALLPPQPLQLFSRHGPVDRQVSAEAERGPGVDPALVRVNARAQVGIKTDLLVGIRPVQQFRPECIGKLFTIRVRHPQGGPDCRRTKYHLIPAHPRRPPRHCFLVEANNTTKFT